jgi:hypothetical protein
MTAAAGAGDCINMELQQVYYMAPADTTTQWHAQHA